MRLPEEKIKQAILHPEPEVRLTALQYFTESHSDDASVMPFVIEAIERYGPPHDYKLLREAERLRQSPATIDWLITQLRRPFNTEVDTEDNLRVALALVLVRSEPALLAQRYNDILSLAAFPEPLKVRLGETLKLEFTDWQIGRAHV